MKLAVVVDYPALCREVADPIKSLARANPMAVIGLPTGETPMGAYRMTVEY